MGIKKTTITEVTLTKEDLKEMIKTFLKINTNIDNITISEVTKTRMIPGLDPHDADYIDEFDGVKITYTE